eukprot:m.114819 g.114819  ORF g.114819 m.114819 type:complete len:1045 (+) comp16314_c1_seq1:508-3642(+)
MSEAAAVAGPADTHTNTEIMAATAESEATAPAVPNPAADPPHDEEIARLNSFGPEQQSPHRLSELVQAGAALEAGLFLHKLLERQEYRKTQSVCMAALSSAGGGLDLALFVLQVVEALHVSGVACLATSTLLLLAVKSNAVSPAAHSKAREMITATLQAVAAKHNQQQATESNAGTGADEGAIAAAEGLQLQPALLLRLTKVFRVNTLPQDKLLAFCEAHLGLSSDGSEVDTESTPPLVLGATNGGDDDDSDTETAREITASEIDAKKAASAAIRLLARFKPEGMRVDAVVQHMLNMDRVSLTVEFLKQLGPGYVPPLVETFVARGHVKSIHGVLAKFDLLEQYPQVARLYKEDKVRRLLRKGFIESAAAHATGLDLKIIVVRHLAEIGTVDLALEYQKKFVIDPPVIDEAFAEEARARFLETHVQLPFAHERIVMVDDADKLAQAAAQLLRSSTDAPPKIVGFDAEWKPSMGTKDHCHPMSILQCAVGTSVFIFDLLRLAPALYGPVLTSLFEDERIIKVGFAVEGDVSRLHAIPWPEHGPNIISLLDARDYANAVAPGWGRSLSDLCKTCLKRELSKVDRISNWERRPLTKRQVAYAGLDANVLLQLLEVCSGVAGLLEDTEAALALLQPHLKTLTHQPRKITKVPRARKAVPLPTAGLDKIKVLSSAGPTVAAAQTTDGPSATGSLHDDSPAVLGRAELRGELERLGLQHTFCDDAEQAPGHRTKSLALYVAEQPIIVVGPIESRVSCRTLAHHFGVARRLVRLASPTECFSEFGYVPGTMPAVGHRKTFPTVVDESLTTGKICCGGGSHETVVVLDAEELVQVVKPTVLDLASLEAPGKNAAQAHVPTFALPPAGSGDEELKFVVDEMLSRLCRWMRCVGYDTVHELAGAEELMRRAREEGRVILTSNRHLPLHRADLPFCIVPARGCEHQFAEVLKVFSLALDKARFMERCTKCNARPFQLLEGEALEAFIASGTMLTPERAADIGDFWQCPNPDCAIIVWQGTQYDKAMHQFDSMYGDDVPPMLVTSADVDDQDKEDS